MADIVEMMTPSGLGPVIPSLPYDPIETSRCLVIVMICVYINYACAYVIEAKMPILYMIRGNIISSCQVTEGRGSAQTRETDIFPRAKA